MESESAERSPEATRRAEVTRLLRLGSAARAEPYKLVYAELRGLAAQRMRGDRHGLSLAELGRREEARAALLAGLSEPSVHAGLSAPARTVLARLGGE